MTGQGRSKTSHDDSRRREVAQKIFFKNKNSPRDTSLKMIIASRGIILSHFMWGYLRTSPPQTMALSHSRNLPPASNGP